MYGRYGVEADITNGLAYALNAIFSTGNLNESSHYIICHPSLFREVPNPMKKLFGRIASCEGNVVLKPNINDKVSFLHRYLLLQSFFSFYELIGCFHNISFF